MPSAPLKGWEGALGKDLTFWSLVFHPEQAAVGAAAKLEEAAKLEGNSLCKDGEPEVDQLSGSSNAAPHQVPSGENLVCK